MEERVTLFWPNLLIGFSNWAGLAPNKASKKGLKGLRRKVYGEEGF